MDSREEGILKLFSRLKKDIDGVELIEYLEQLANDNYNAFKLSDSSKNDIHKGYAIAIDSLLKTFEDCDNRLQKSKVDLPNIF